MKQALLLEAEQSLDPVNWSQLNQLGHRMLDDLFYYLETAGKGPVWTKPPQEAINSIREPVPQSGTEATDLYELFANHILPYNISNMHPRFWGWVQGGGTPLGMLADMLASGMNTNVSMGDNMPMQVDKQVAEWSKQIMGFPDTAGGLLVSGASIANITALIAARHYVCADIKSKGIRAIPEQLVIYGSSETHYCVVKGVEVIGIGSDHFRKVPVDKDYRIQTDALKRMIVEDREAGLRPFCIVGNAGTVNTGAIDPLHQLVVIAQEEKLWLHIDGAFGAIPKLLPEFDDELKAIELADSLSFDFHKWMSVNYEAGCVLIRNATLHREAFASAVNYLALHERGISAGPDGLQNYGMELSRNFKALKIWMMLKAYGLDQFRTIIRQNLRQTRYLATLIEQEPLLELMAPVPLNIVCYRFNPGNLDRDQLNRLNKELLMQMQEEGIAAPTYTLLNNQYVIRVAHTNHRSRLKDFDTLVQATLRIGKRLTGS
jgi:Glutamate decarboxylase and related PLP-dependent proteins